MADMKRIVADNVVDLDVLRPEPRFVKLGGKEIDVSFIPTGITFEIDAVVREMGKLDQAAVQAGEGEDARRGFDLTVELCSLFCRRKHPEMTPEWFGEHTDAGQLSVFAEAIKAALFRSYEGIEEYQQATPPKAKTGKTQAG